MMTGVGIMLQPNLVIQLLKFNKEAGVQLQLK